MSKGCSEDYGDRDCPPYPCAAAAGAATATEVARAATRAAAAAAAPVRLAARQRLIFYMRGGCNS